MTKPRVKLRISSPAADFVRGQSASQSTEMALMVFGVVLGTPPNVARPEVDNRSDEDLIKRGRSVLNTLPPKVRVKWTVGLKELDRLPKEDIHVIDGVACYLPEEMIAVIEDRTVVLDEGQLRFDPDLEVFETDRPTL